MTQCLEDLEGVVSSHSAALRFSVEVQAEGSKQWNKGDPRVAPQEDFWIQPEISEGSRVQAARSESILWGTVGASDGDTLSSPGEGL